MMDLSFRHDLWIRRLARSARDEGRLEGLVARPPGAAPGARRILTTARLTPEGGMEGDRWSAGDTPQRGNQVSLINVHLLAALSESDPERMALSGDNLQVDLDLSEESLPPGTRLEIGSAVLEVSTMPHRPCRFFRERYGATGAKRVARANRLGLRGRGVLCSVVQAGEVAVGDAIRVRRS